MHELQLHFIGQTRGDSVDVIFFCMTAFGLQKKLVRGFVGKLYDFVLDRRTIARARALYPAGIKRGTMQISLDDFMGLRTGVRDPARHLFHVELTSAIKIKGENLVLSPFLVLVKGTPRRLLVPE